MSGCRLPNGTANASSPATDFMHDAEHWGGMGGGERGSPVLSLSGNGLHTLLSVSVKAMAKAMSGPSTAVSLSHSSSAQCHAYTLCISCPPLTVCCVCSSHLPTGDTATAAVMAWRRLLKGISSTHSLWWRCSSSATTINYLQSDRLLEFIDWNRPEHYLTQV